MGHHIPHDLIHFSTSSPQSCSMASRSGTAEPGTAVAFRRHQRRQLTPASARLLMGSLRKPLVQAAGAFPGCSLQLLPFTTVATLAIGATSSAPLWRTCHIPALQPIMRMHHACPSLRSPLFLDQPSFPVAPREKHEINPLS